MSQEDRDIICALIGQVMQATPAWGSERNVTTVITRPLWRKFLRASNTPEDTEPTEWLGMKKTQRVFGSRTVVVEADCEMAVSFYQPSNNCISTYCP